MATASAADPKKPSTLKVGDALEPFKTLHLQVIGGAPKTRPFHLKTAGLGEPLKPYDMVSGRALAVMEMPAGLHVVLLCFDWGMAVTLRNYTTCCKTTSSHDIVAVAVLPFWLSKNIGLFQDV